MQREPPAPDHAGPGRARWSARCTLARAVAPDASTPARPVKYKNRNVRQRARRRHHRPVPAHQRHRPWPTAGSSPPAEAEGGRPVCVHRARRWPPTCSRTNPPLGKRIKVGAAHLRGRRRAGEAGQFPRRDQPRQPGHHPDQPVRRPTSGATRTSTIQVKVQRPGAAGRRRGGVARRHAPGPPRAAGRRRTISPSTSRSSSSRRSTAWPAPSPPSACSSPACRCSSAASAS